MVFQGSFTALITPFTRKGHLDTKTIEKLVQWHISQGTDGIVCCATTGEGLSLSDGERRKVAEICIATAAKRMAVIVATGTCDTKLSVRYTERAKKMGADGCLAVTPYYNKPSQKGCLLHFQEIAKVGLPLIVYQNPARTIIRLSEETILQLAQIPNIVGIKDSGRDLEMVKKVAKAIPVFCGDDDLTVSVMKAGGAGSISTVANLIPRGWKEMITLCLKGEWEQAQRKMDRYLPLCHTIFAETNPQVIKFALSWLGRCLPVLRLPMLLPEETIQRKCKRDILRLSLPQFSLENVARSEKY